MLQILSFLKSFVKYEKVKIDNVVFWLHYRVTAIILMAFALFIITNEFIGGPINCVIDEIPKDVIETFCWIHGTYTVSKKMEGELGRDYLYPGVTSFNSGPGEEKIKEHLYYQWVPFMLLFQALMFYIPHYVWKTCEGGRIKMLSTNLNLPISEAEHRRERKLAVIEYLYENLHHHNFYLFRFVFCELLNLMNIIAQILFIDYFLDGEFSTYGIKVFDFIQMKPEIRGDPMAHIFPKVTKCLFYKYGPSGSIEHLDSICLLPLNVINEKVYIFLWFWFLLLSTLSLVALIYRIQILCIPKLRSIVLLMRVGFSSRIATNKVLIKCYIGDWFILYQLSKNIDPMIFRDIISELNNKIDLQEDNLL